MGSSNRADKYSLMWQMYGPVGTALVLLCHGSSDELRIILKFMYCNHCGTPFWKALNHNCSMTAVGSTVVALIAITSLLMPDTGQVHWLSPAMWIVSLLSAFLSVLFACKHQRFMGSLLLEDSRHLCDIKKWFQKGKMSGKAVPRLRVLLLLSSTKVFFDTALIAYVVGLGIYLGFKWQHDGLGADAGADAVQNVNDRNVFVMFLVFVSFGIGVCCIFDCPSSCELAEWSLFLKRYEAGETPNVLGCRCLDRQPEGKGDIEDVEAADVALTA